MQFQADTIIIACIVAVIAPSVLAIGNSRIQDKRQEKQWARDDALEARRLLREEAFEKATELSLKKNSEKLKSIENETKIIHSLVNSELTRAYESDLTAVIESKEAIQKVIDITIKLGNDPDPIDLRDLVIKETRISELEHIISSRYLRQSFIDNKLSKGN